MSNGSVTPIRRPPPGAQQQDWDDSGWWWNGSNWVPHPEHPIWPPQSGMPCPPQPCPQPPSCFSAVAKAQSCYDQSQALYNLVSQVVSDIFAKNPGIIPTPPPGSSSAPIIGITDGTPAKAGEVGEYISGVANYSYPASAVGLVISGSVGPLVIPPGDWDVWLNGYTSGYVNGLSFSATGAHLENQMWSSMASGVSDIAPVLWGGPSRSLVSVPTLLTVNFVIYINETVGLPAGTLSIQASARRVR